MRLLLSLLILLPTCALASECRFTEQRDVDIDAASLKTLALVLGSNDVTVEGVPDLAKVEVRARLCASDQKWLAGLEVRQQRSGDRLTLTPHRTGDLSGNWFRSSYARIDLTVRVPAAMAVAIESQSGDAAVRGVSALDFRASSGDLDVHRIAGALTVEVSSGDVKGDEIGSVDVRSTSSGDIELRSVRGDVKVARAGSADLTFDQVGGKIEIGSVGSGDLSISRVEGDVSVDAIGSGDIDANVIGGNFTVRAKGSGDVSHRGVRGTVSVPRSRD